MKIALFGGSFDPIHQGHLEVAKAALNELDIDRLFVVPAWQNPFKEGFFAPPQIRLEWVKAAFAGDEFTKISICEFEINLAKPTPTILTAEFLKTRHNTSEVLIIIGEDNLATLHKWSEFDRLCQLAKFVIATREESSNLVLTNALEERKFALKQTESLEISSQIRPFVKQILSVQNPLTSTQIRRRLKAANQQFKTAKNSGGSEEELFLQALESFEEFLPKRVAKSVLEFYLN